MSGDTPTAHFGMKLHNLECPDCSSDVFARETAHWTTDLAEHCAGCGSDLRVALDEDPEDPDVLTARVFVHEHGGDVVARLRAEGLELDAQLRVETRVRVSAQAEAERLTQERDDAKAKAASHWAERVEEAIVAARAGREAASQRERAETAERERDDARNMYIEDMGCDPGWIHARGWGYLCPEWMAKRGYPEDSTTDETEPRRPGPDDMHGACDVFGGSDF